MTTGQPKLVKNLKEFLERDTLQARLLHRIADAKRIALSPSGIEMVDKIHAVLDILDLMVKNRDCSKDIRIDDDGAGRHGTLSNVTTKDIDADTWSIEGVWNPDPTEDEGATIFQCAMGEACDDHPSVIDESWRENEFYKINDNSYVYLKGTDSCYSPREVEMMHELVLRLQKRQATTPDESWRELDGLRIFDTGEIEDLITGNWLLLLDAHTGLHIVTRVQLTHRGRESRDKLIRRWQERQSK